MITQDESLFQEWCRWVDQWRIDHNVPLPEHRKKLYPELATKIDSVYNQPSSEGASDASRDGGLS